MKRHNRPARRGHALLEFALCLPVVLSLLLGVLDYGWYFFQQGMLLDAAKDGCRVGVSVGATEDPALRAEAVALEILEDSGLGRPDALAVDGGVTTLSGIRVLRLTLDMPFTPLVGLVPAPTHLKVTRTMVLERQGSGYYAPGV